MPQNKPSPGYLQRGRRFKLPTPNPVPQLSLLREYPYVFLVAFFAVATIAGEATGMSLSDALILGAWATSLVFFGWQLWRFLRYRANPEAAAKREAEKKAFLNAKAREARSLSNGKPAAKIPTPAKPKIAAVPRKPAQRVPIRKPGMNVKPQPQPEEPPKT